LFFLLKAGAPKPGTEGAAGSGIFAGLWLANGKYFSWVIRGWYELIRVSYDAQKHTMLVGHKIYERFLNSIDNLLLALKWQVSIQYFNYTGVTIGCC